MGTVKRIRIEICGSGGPELAGRLTALLPDRALYDTAITDTAEELPKRSAPKLPDMLIVPETELKRIAPLFPDIIADCMERRPDMIIIVFTMKQTLPAAMRAIEAGAYQYVRMPAENDEIRLLLESSLQKLGSGGGRENADQETPDKFGGIIGQTDVMQAVFEQVRQAAETDIPVLIVGETGTGKDLLAFTLHKLSLRRDEPYLAVNLGALPPELVASELFGHEKGAFTGAVHQHKGVFEQGNKGTVFLDEIDSMSEKIQVSLLRLLEQKKFKRLGGSRSINSAARIIAASNEDLDSLTRQGSFRSDLFYRLDVFRISLPALRDRKEDIPLIAEELRLKYAQKYNRNIQSISRSAMTALVDFEWPGNVRELKNVIQRAILVCDEAEIQLEHLPQRFHHFTTESPTITVQIGTPLAAIEEDILIATLEANQNNRAKSAKDLKISRRTLYNKLEKYGRKDK